jgi:hypothetical protein
VKYRPDIEAVIDRYRQLFTSPEPAGILVHVFVPPDGSVPYDLRNYGFPNLQENARYIQTYIENRTCFLRARLPVQDDYVPDIFIHHGIGIHSAFVAGQPIFGEDTSWSGRVIETWADLDHLQLSEDNPWFRVLCHTADLFVEKLYGQVGIATFYHYSPLDLANALRGNQIFLDFYDSPDEVRRLLNFCAKAILWLEERLWRITGDLQGGTPLWGSWLPGHALMMSEDIADLCEPEAYPRWAQPWTQNVIDRFQGALIHNHALGMHVQQKIAQLKALQVLQISEDPNQPHPIDHLPHLIQVTGGIPLQVYCRPEEVEQAVNAAQAGRVILQTSASDAATANEIVRYVRNHSRIKAG